MAFVVGKAGKVKIGATPDEVLEVSAFTYSEETEEIEVVAMGQDKRFAGGTVEGSGSVTVNFDPDDTTGQKALRDKVNAVDQTIVVELFPEGDSAPYTKFDGTVTILSWELNSDAQGIVGASFNFRGKLAWTDVAV